MHTIPSLSPSRVLALLLLFGAAAIAQVPVPLTALSAGPRTPFPNATDYSFESTVGIGQIQYGSWASWVMTGNSGIAHQAHAWVAPLNAPGGRRVAFVQGVSAVAVSIPMAAGNWRVRFQGAQRQDATSHQVVQVWIDSTLVFEGELLAGGFQEYTTRTLRIATPPPLTKVTIQGTSTNTNDIGLVDLIELEPVADWNTASSWSPAFVPVPSDEAAWTCSRSVAAVSAPDSSGCAAGPCCARAAARRGGPFRTTRATSSSVSSASARNVAAPDRAAGSPPVRRRCSRSGRARARSPVWSRAAGQKQSCRCATAALAEPHRSRVDELRTPRGRDRK